LGRSDKKLLSRWEKSQARRKSCDLMCNWRRCGVLKVPREPRRKTQLVNHLIGRRTQQGKKLRKEASKIRFERFESG